MKVSTNLLLRTYEIMLRTNKDFAAAAAPAVRKGCAFPRGLLDSSEATPQKRRSRQRLIKRTLAVRQSLTAQQSSRAAKSLFVRNVSYEN